MTIRRAVAGPLILATGLFLTSPLVSLAAAPGGPDGDHNGVVCGPGQMAPHGDLRGFRGPPPGPRPGLLPGDEWGAPPPFLMGVKLTEEQQDKVFGILYAAAPPSARSQKRCTRREALMALSFSGQYDESRAKALADTVAKADSQLTLLRRVAVTATGCRLPAHACRECTGAAIQVLSI